MMNTIKWPGQQELQAWRHDFHRHPETAFQEHRTSARVEAPAPNVVLIFGDVSQMQEIAEGTDDRNHRVARQFVEHRFELGARGRVELARRVLVQRDGGLPDAFDGGEDVFALLFAHGVALFLCAQRRVFQRHGNVLFNVEPGEQTVILKHDAALQPRAVDGLAIEQDAPLVLLVQAQNQAQQGWTCRNRWHRRC